MRVDGRLVFLFLQFFDSFGDACYLMFQMLFVFFEALDLLVSSQKTTFISTAIVHFLHLFLIQIRDDWVVFSMVGDLVQLVPTPCRHNTQDHCQGLELIRVSFSYTFRIGMVPVVDIDW